MHVTLEKCNCSGIAEDARRLSWELSCAYKRCFLQFLAPVAAGTVVYSCRAMFLCGALRVEPATDRKTVV